jgi:hypothetical protein
MSSISVGLLTMIQECSLESSLQVLSNLLDGWEPNREPQEPERYEPNQV